MWIAIRSRIAAGRPAVPPAWVAAVTLGIAGCSASAKSELPLTAVTGKVSLEGAPLAEAVIEFIPMGDTRGLGGSAITNADGQYQATNATGESGLPAGDYQVTISKQELPKGATAPVGEVSRADSPYRETLPRAYSDPSATKLTAKVASGSASVNDFDLKAKSR